MKVAVVALVGVGVSRDGRFFKWLRELRDQVDSGSSTGDLTDVDHSDVPEVAEYLAFLNTLELRHFSAREIVRPHLNVRDGVSNNVPPKSLWEEITLALRTADELRERLGARAQILSGYRSPAYNTAINGASSSQHMRNRALDLKFDCSSDQAFAVAEQLRAEGFFMGGIGWYPSFIHIDTRGRKATWGKEASS